MKIGPTEIIINEKYLSCQGCEFYHSNMMVSGRHPIYSHNCIHPKLKDQIFSFTGNLHAYSHDKIETPEWCPVLKEQV